MFWFYSTFSVFSSLLAIALSHILFRFRRGYWKYANAKTVALHKNDFSRCWWWYRTDIYIACITPGPAGSYTTAQQIKDVFCSWLSLVSLFKVLGGSFVTDAFFTSLFFHHEQFHAVQRQLSSIISILWLVTFINYLCLVPVALLELRTYDSVNVHFVRVCYAYLSLPFEYERYIWRIVHLHTELHFPNNFPQLHFRETFIHVPSTEIELLVWLISSENSLISGTYRGIN